MKVTFAIPTYKRPVCLTACLNAIQSLTFAKSAEPLIEVIVIDNDPDGSSRTLCEPFTKSQRFSVKYCCEKKRGITYARNRAIAETAPDSDFLAFVDDDEEVHHLYLDELLYSQKIHSADVVMGMVHFRFEIDPPSWIIKGNFFSFPVPPVGPRCEIATASTGGVLISKQVLKSMNYHFDHRFALTGGEDRNFFNRVHKAGFRIVFHKDALAIEFVPRERMNARWIVMRRFMEAVVYSRDQLELNKNRLAVFFERITKSIFRIIYGSLLLILGIFIGKHITITGLCNAMRGIGSIAGLFGFNYQPYNKTQGK